MNDKRYTRLQEIAKQKGKQLLIENYLLSIDVKNVEQFVESKLIESKGEKYKARGVLKKVPVSKYTENLNGRVYIKELWEKVKKEGAGEGTLALMGHPEDDGNPKDIAGVFHNLEITENCPVADIYLVGRHGQDILEAIEAGSRQTGLSTVGFGDFLEDGKTVDPNSYELERLGDFVLNPSQGVFATFENLQKENVSISEKNITNKKGIFYKNDTNKREEKNNEVLIMDKFQISNLKNHVNSILKEAIKNSNISDALDTIKDISIPEEVPELHEKVQETIAKLQNKLNEQKSFAEETIEKKDEEIKDLTEKMELAEKTISEMTEKLEKAQAIIEKTGISESEDIDVELLKENIKNMSEDIKIIDHVMEHESVKSIGIEKPEDFVVLAEDTVDRDDDITQLMEEREEMLDDIEKFEESYNNLKSDLEFLENALKEAEDRIETYEEELENLGFEFEEKEEKKDDKKKKKDEEEDEDEKDEEEDEEDDDEEVEEGKDKKKKKKEKVFDKNKKRMKENKEYTFDFNNSDPEPEELEEEVKDRKKSSLSEDSELKIFIEHEIKKNKGLKDIKKELYKSKSITEAIEKIEKFTETSEDIFEEETDSDLKPYSFSK